MGMVSDFVLGSYVLDGMGMVSDFVLGSYVLSSKPKTKSDTHEGLASFNPLPAMKPGGTVVPTGASAGNFTFQSAPGDEAGRNAGRKCWMVPDDRFQSAPGDEAGRNRRFADDVPPPASFNPLPAMKPGGTSWMSSSVGGASVSIRSRR